MENINRTLAVCKNKPIIHSDHGFQYTSLDYTNLVNLNKFTPSMSRVGNSLDNRPAEYFFSIFKQEF